MVDSLGYVDKTSKIAEKSKIVKNYTVSEKYSITVVKTATLGDNMAVELAHNKTKELWFVTFRGDFYTEFTFKDQEEADKMYEASLNSEVFMDSLAEAANEMSDAEISAYEEGR
jgi:hypothetical protein